MTKSRELTNYCQESVKPLQSKKISDSLDNYHLKDAIDYITNSLIEKDKFLLDSNELFFDNPLEEKEIEVYERVLNYIENYLTNFDS